MATPLHPLIAAWFESRFGSPTEPQAQGWPRIAAGEDTLIVAPTGSGKTLAAFLMAIDTLFRMAIEGRLGAETQVVYVSPLKALANDVEKNLRQPLEEILAASAAAGCLMSPIRVGVRTGDTPAAERTAMLRHPPHILVTTPESLYILLTATRGRAVLSTARTVIVDEIHALAGNKRGAHLALTLERLEALTAAKTATPPQRIGLSATVRPLETIADFLGGARSRPGIVHVPDTRRLDLGIEAPASELGPIATNEQWEERYDRLAELAAGHRSTLVFVNTRKLAERVAHRMRERLGEAAVAAHHGSLSRIIRLHAEERFKRGELRMMVATASLELGLDIGTVDLVAQIGSPRLYATALQRVGRAGHWGGGRSGVLPKGRFFPTTRDELLECAAVIRGLRQRRLETMRVPEWPRDILAQQIVAAVAAAGPDGDWLEDDLYKLCRRAWPYRELPREEFDAIVTLLAEGVSGRRGRRGTFLHRDGVHHRLRPRRGARLAAITCGGAIVENATYLVQAEPENVTVGTLDEDFAVESNYGDVFLLGSTSWRVRGIETGRVRVEDAHGAAPTVPFWLGEAPSRSDELSQGVGELRTAVAERLEDGTAPAWLEAECGLNETAARQLAAYVRSGRDALGGVPTPRYFIAERFFDDGGGMQVVIHAPLGAAINKAWGMALRKRFCRGFDFELQAAAHDNGLVLSLSEQHSFPLATIFDFLSAGSVKDVLEQAVLQSPVFGTRWRWTVSRALALLRFVSGRKLAPQLQRMRAEDLLAAAFPMQLGCQDNHGGEDVPIPDHPYVRETMRDCLHEFLDLDGLQAMLSELGSSAITIAAVDTPAASVFSHEILNVGRFGFLDEAPLEERRARAVHLQAVGTPTPGALDAAAVDAVRSEAWPQPETAEELHDLLLSTCWFPDAEFEPTWRSWLAALHASGRVAPATAETLSGWTAAERAGVARDAGLEVAADAGPGGTELAGPIWPGVEFAGATGDAREAAWARIAGGWMEIAGPLTSAALSARLGLPLESIETALLILEGQGRVVRGNWAGDARESWCERGLLARIQRRSLLRRRAEIEPVSPAGYYGFLLRWQHVALGSRLHGLAGLQAVLEQLQGFEAAASAWETRILPARVADYAPELLDQLCMSGEIAWARLSPPAAPAGLSSGMGMLRRLTPSRNSPMTFFRRDDATWLLAASGWTPETRAMDAEEARPLSPEAAQVWAALRQRGASFFGDLARSLEGVVKSQIEDALWELVAAGAVTADGFDSLRAFLDPKRRAGQGGGRMQRPRHGGGRWAEVRELAAATEPAGPGERALQAADLAERQARQWLRRYGVVFKAVLARENSALPWYQVLLACRRLEARGEIRGGRFVSGFSGEQFALPQAVESLRALRRLDDAADESVAARLSGSDPLNLAGIILPGDRVPARAGSEVGLAVG